ncbi:MAG: tRNA pseudouridine(55) synthase TruB, partial [Chloroflexi bacterium]|nr:tRNA pseudouridine(55) synthase TruB [Chloroflexota bacterium]
IEIFAIESLAIELTEVELVVRSSKATYIRELAHDLGAQLGCGAHLRALTRLASGEFKLDDALTLDQLREVCARGEIQKKLYPLDRALSQFQAAQCDSAVVKKIQNGIAVQLAGDFTSPLVRAYAPDGELIALLEPTDDEKIWKPKKVFIN